MKKFTTSELEKLMIIMAKDFDNYFDDVYTSDNQMFQDNVSKFIQWLEKMDNEGKIKYLLGLPI